MTLSSSSTDPYDDAAAACEKYCVCNKQVVITPL